MAFFTIKIQIKKLPKHRICSHWLLRLSFYLNSIWSMPDWFRENLKQSDQVRLYLMCWQRMLTFFVRESISVRLTTSCFTDSTKQVNLLLIKHEQSSSLIQKSKTGVQLLPLYVSIISGQSYKRSAIVIYVSKDVLTRKLVIFAPLES